MRRNGSASRPRDLTVEDGVVRVKAAPDRSVSYGALIGDGVKLDVDAKIELKKPPDYKVIGKSIRARRHSGEGDGRIHLHP